MRKVDDQPLVGRAAEMAALERAVDGLRRDAAPALVLEGEAGIGKTRLLSELAAHADRRGSTVLHGSASELERDLPFWVFVDALDSFVAGLNPRVLDGLSADVQAELAQVLPSLAERAAPAPPVLQDQRYRVHRATRALLERLAATQPLVLILDDVHWADPASVDLLAALLREPPAAAVMLVLAARPHQLADPLGGALERADRAGGLVRVPLGGLPREATAELLGRAASPAAVERLHAECGGNPLYLLQLSRVQAGGTGRAGGVPRAVLASLAEEVGVLPAAAQQLLRGAAVAGDPFDLDLAVAAAGLDDGGVVDAFDALLAAELVRDTEIPRRFRFRHPVARHAVYEAAPGGWRLAAHDRAAALLAARGASATARAHHVEFAAQHGDPASLAVLTEAGEAALLRAPAAAARWLGAALRLLPAGAEPESRLRLLLARARALAAQGQLAESHADLIESVRLAPSDAPALRVQLATACAAVERLLGRHDDARTRLLACFEELAEPDGADAVALMIEVAIDALFRSEADAVCEWAARALAAARALGDAPLVASASAMLTLGEAVAGRIDAARTAYAGTAALLASMADDELLARPDALSYLCSAATFLDRFDEACTHAERALRLARATGQLHPTLIPALGAAHLMRGRLAQAAEVLDDGVEAGRLSGVTQALAWALRNRSLLSAAEGRADEALAAADEGFELIAHLDESVLTSWAAMAVARAAMLAGRPERALAVLAPADGKDVLLAIPGTWRTLGYDVLADAYLALDRGDAARVTAQTALQHAAALDLPTATLWAERAAARVALHAGDAAGAAQRAQRSREAAEAAGAIVEGALTRMLEATAHERAGDVEAAAAALEAAAATFGECGADPHRLAAEQQLRRLGRAVHRKTRRGAPDAAGLAALTGRELEIAMLVADRHTNQEIAGTLFLSVKTVESHLRNIFRKAGVASRVELARAVERDRPSEVRR